MAVASRKTILDRVMAAVLSQKSPLFFYSSAFGQHYHISFQIGIQVVLLIDDLAAR